MIFVYYDADGIVDPPYELDPYPFIDDGTFVYRGTCHEVVDMHLQEFSENAVVSGPCGISICVPVHNENCTTACNREGLRAFRPAPQSDEDSMDRHLCPWHSD
jgi:hypothetical protein